MFGWLKRKPVLTNEAYEWWLRAGRPQPLPWFLDLSRAEQLTMATLGDEYAEDFCVAVGLAVQDPQLAAAGLDTDDIASEEILARRLAAKMVAEAVGAPQPTPEPTAPPSPVRMGGLGQRRAGAQEGRQKDLSRSRSLLGRKPDEVSA